MKLGNCIIKSCDKSALWIVTTKGHPNAPGELTHEYCTDHVTAPTWEDSTTPYNITITGPHRGKS